MTKWSVLLSFFPFCALAQSFAPEPGQPGSTAIHVDSSIILNWASSVEIERGWMDIQNTALGYAAYGSDVDALGLADGQPISLGDGGMATLKFPYGISNGPGPDFAVFENGFADHYMELAHVEVSSDGINFFRFSSVSETPTETQLNNFSFSNCAYLNNLAGKYRVYFGTPFDLEELSGQVGLDIDNVTYVRLIDVVGSIDPGVGTMDSQGNVINDPYPTAFDSGGFDLDAVAVLHEVSSFGLEEVALKAVIFPNPVSEFLYVDKVEMEEWMLSDLYGSVLLQGQSLTEGGIDFRSFPAGIYLLNIRVKGEWQAQRIIKH